MDMMSSVLAKCNGNIVTKAFNEQIDLVVSLPVDEAPNFLNRFKPY
jgi:hypothetical protein